MNGYGLCLVGSAGEATAAGSSGTSADNNTCVACSGSGCTATTNKQQREAGTGGGKSKYHLSCLTHGQQRASITWNSLQSKYHLKLTTRRILLWRLYTYMFHLVAQVVLISNFLSLPFSCSQVLKLGFDEKFIRIWEFYLVYSASGLKSWVARDYLVRMHICVLFV